jgi:transposase
MCRIVLAHPKYVKGIRGKKTDKKDAKWIADLFKHDLVNGSFIPPHDIRQLRDLIRYNFKLTSYSTGEKNRAQNCLTVSNLKLDDVFSDVFGKSATNIINHMLEHPGQPFDVSPFVHKGCKTSIEEIQAAVDGAICSEQAEKLRVIRTHLDDLDKAKANLQSAIFNIAEKFLPQINIVASVPGIRAFSAIAIIAEIGVDMSVFPTDKHLCSWAGLTPQNDESAGKKKTTRISRAGAYIKPLLVQCANAAIKSSKHPEFKKRYLKLKKRRGHKKAIIAIARMILTAIYHMLKNNEEYDPKLYNNDVDKRKPMKPDFSLEQAIAFVQSKGFSVSTISHNSTDSG